MKKAKVTRVKTDAYENMVTAVGTRKDKSRYTKAVVNKMTAQEVDRNYVASKVLRKIVEIFPRYSLKDGYSLVIEENPEAAKLLMDAVQRLRIHLIVKKAAIFGRLYGGAAIIPIIADGLDLMEPVDLNRIREVSGLRVISREKLSPMEISEDILSEWYGKPEFYQLSGGGIIHASRVIRFEGDMPGECSEADRQYWGVPVVESMLSAVQDYETAAGSIANILGDFLQTVYKFENLKELIASGKEDLVQKRMELIDITRSMVNSIVLDGDESFERLQSPVNGLSDLFDRVLMRLTIDSQIPHTLLLGESPSGLGATGDSEKIDFYDTVSEYRDEQITPAVERIATLIMASKTGPTKGVVYQVTVTYPSLWKTSPQEDADVRLKTAQTDKLYVEMGADPDSIIESRYRDGVFNQEVDLQVADSDVDLSAFDEPPTDNNRSDSDDAGFKPTETMVKKAAKYAEKTDASPYHRDIARLIASGEPLDAATTMLIFSASNKADADLDFIGGPSAKVWSRKHSKQIRKDGYPEAGVRDIHTMWFDGSFTPEQAKNFVKNMGLSGGTWDEMTYIHRPESEFAFVETSCLGGVTVASGILIGGE